MSAKLKRVKLEEFPDRQTARIAQHFNGIRHSRHVKRHGLEPLWSLNCFTQRVPAGKVMSAENAFHDELHLNGITLRGDGGTAHNPRCFFQNEN